MSFELQRLLWILYINSFSIWSEASQNLNNIDVFEPVIRVSPSRAEAVNDYFGWTAIFHAVQELNQPETMQTMQEKVRIIVGAPYGSFAGGLSYNDPFGPRVDRTGLVYNCPVAPGNCAGVRGNLGSYINNENLADNTPLGQGVIGHIETSIQPFMPEEYAEGRLFDQAPNARVTLGNLLGTRNYDYKEGQLLGATLYSNGDVFMACAPRWRLILGSGSNVESIRGMCFSGGRNMQDFVPRMMCTSAATNGIGDNGLDWMCAAGHSVVVNDENIVVGAPGYTNNRGALIRVRVADPFDTVPTVGDIIARGDDGTVLTDAQDQYQGFRTINAHISNTRTPGMSPNLVTSVPRAGINKNGRLNVYASPTSLDTLIFTNATGTQIGEFFGYSLAADDLQNDGDFAVGAPYYQASTGSNTGAVFIYYGRADPTNIPTQMPYMITADTMAMNVDLGMNLNTFGFSLSSGYDVDANGYNDLLVGAYESQSVFLLRSLPVADVNVQFSPHPPVNVENTWSFMLEITATFNGLGVGDQLDVSFEVREVVQMTPRVFFDAAHTPTVPGRGAFSFVSQGVNATANVTVYTKDGISDFSPLIFNITLLEISCSVSGPVTGNETLRDLSSFPCLRLQGQTTTQVEINFCGIDGCKTDVLFLTVPSPEIEVIKDGPELGRVTITFSNNGSEPALNLAIVITSIPDFVSTITVVDHIFTSCVRTHSNLTCLFSQRRFNSGQSFMATFVFGFDTESLTGVENESMVTLRLFVPEENQNEDTDATNNELTVILRPTVQADISISTVEFTPSVGQYTGVAPANDMVFFEGIDAFDTEITLVVTIGNVGPSTIQNATLDVFFPSRLESITGTFSFLYPYDIQSGPIVTCDRSYLDPERLQQLSSPGEKSAKSLSEKRVLRRHNRASSRNSVMADSNKRAEQQEKNSYDLDCTPGSPDSAECILFTCSISNLRRENTSINFRSRIDERFFATLIEDGDQSFNLRAYAAVRLGNSCCTGDDPSNNANSGSLVLTQGVQQSGSYSLQDLIHVTLWPALGSFVFLIILVLILYRCGFFRRKKKPVHEGTSNEPETDPHQEDSKLTDSDHENIALQETHTQAGQVQHFELDTKENNTVDRKNDTSTDDQLDNTTHGDSQAHGDDDALDKPDQSH